MIKKLKYLDKTLFFISILLFVIGLVMIFSASNVTAYMSHAVSPYNYFLRQSVFLIAGLLLFFIMIAFNTNVYGKSSRLLLIINTAALVVLLIYGSAKNQAISWFDLGFISIQPSEFIKVISIVYLAEYYEVHRKNLKGAVISLFPIGICIAIAGLIFLQPDLGTTIIYAVTVAIIFFAVPVAKEIKFKLFFIGCAILFLGGFAIMSMGKNILEDRQLERFDISNPCEKILSKGNQVCNCYIAINNGGLTGVGLGNSTQKYLYLPEPYTDFIFAIIIEELGVITGIAIILLYIVILFRILIIGRRAITNRGAIICYGTAAYIFLHIAVNLMGIMGMIPMTGVPLPFMSYGGSYTICLIAALTMVQRVNIDTKLYNEKGDKRA